MCLSNSGVAIGSGWQGVVAYVNLFCYYFIGLPIGCVLGFKLGMGVAVSLNHSPKFSYCFVIVNDRTCCILYSLFSGYLVGVDYWSFPTNCSSSCPHCQNKLECSGNLNSVYEKFVTCLIL